MTLPWLDLPAPGISKGMMMEDRRQDRAGLFSDVSLLYISVRMLLPQQLHETTANEESAESRVQTNIIQPGFVLFYQTGTEHPPHP